MREQSLSQCLLPLEHVPAQCWEGICKTGESTTYVYDLQMLELHLHTFEEVIKYVLKTNLFCKTQGPTS